MNPETPINDYLAIPKDFTVRDAPSYYHPTGKWAYMADKPIEKMRFGATLNYGVNRNDPTICLAKGYADGSLVPLLCKRYDIWREWPGFHTEMYLYASSDHLRLLQGKCVPHIISVQTIPGGYLTVNCELLSTKGWSDAHPDNKFISQEKKKRVLEAYHRIHKQGILHGSVSLQNIAISDDGRVHILDFRKARALVSCRGVGLYSCTQQEIDLEMRYVRFILDWHGARKKEKEIWEGTSPESQAQWLTADKARSQRSAANKVPRQSHEVWDVEKEQWRVFDNRNTWFASESKLKPPRKHVVPVSFIDDCYLGDAPDLQSPLDVQGAVNAALLDPNYSMRPRAGSRSSRSHHSERREQPIALFQTPVFDAPLLASLQLDNALITPYLERVEKAARQYQSQLGMSPDSSSSLDHRLLEAPPEGETMEQKMTRLKALNNAIEDQACEVEIANATQEFYTRLEKVVLAERDRFEDFIKKKASETLTTTPEARPSASAGSASSSADDAVSPGTTAQITDPSRASHLAASVPRRNGVQADESSTSGSHSSGLASKEGETLVPFTTFGNYLPKSESVKVDRQLSPFLPSTPPRHTSPSTSSPRHRSVGTPEPVSEDERKRALSRRVGGILNRRAPARGRHGPVPNRRSRLDSPSQEGDGVEDMDSKDEGPGLSGQVRPSSLAAADNGGSSPRKRKRDTTGNDLDTDAEGDVLKKRQGEESRTWGEPVTKRLRQAFSYVASFWI